MNLIIRPAAEPDVEACGRILYDAFQGIAKCHNFRPDIPSLDLGFDFARYLIDKPSVYGVVAELDQRVIGSNFLTERSVISGIGPITVAPAAQGHKIGRRLMEAVIDRGRNAQGIRLVQDSYNMLSLSLYASLGFDVREPLILLEGRLEGAVPAGVEIRPMQPEDIDECASLCRRVHGFDRAHELRDGAPLGQPFVARKGAGVIAYTSAAGFWPFNHAVAESEEAMQALLIGAGALIEDPLSFLFPLRQASLFRWCLGRGMRAIKPMTLMSMGWYQEPRGCYLPSTEY